MSDDHTRIILVMRHAEKPDDDTDLNLSPAGVARAKKLATYIPATFGKPGHSDPTRRDYGESSPGTVLTRGGARKYQICLQGIFLLLIALAATYSANAAARKSALPARSYGDVPSRFVFGGIYAPDLGMDRRRPQREEAYQLHRHASNRGEG
jgi:hypothetical protein